MRWPFPDPGPEIEAATEIRYCVLLANPVIVHEDLTVEIIRY